MKRSALLVGFGLIVALMLVPGARPQAPKPAGIRYAILVGVNEYEHRQKLPALKYAVNDVTDLKKILGASDYKVTLLTNDTETKPTREEIDKAIREVLRKAKAGDTVVMAFAGHGLQFKDDKDSYFCPIDARPFKDETKTLISMGAVYAEMEKSFAGVKVLLVDACRDDPDEGRGSRGIDADSAPRPPRGVAAFFSCSAKQKAFEHDSLKHGVFFHYVLEGLKGKAKNDENDVTFNSLVDYVARNVVKSVPKLYEGAEQQPNQKADLSGISPVLLKIGVDIGKVEPMPMKDDIGKVEGRPQPLVAPFSEPEAKKARQAWAKYLKLEEKKSLDLGKGVKLDLVLIPPGKYKMGSPQGDKNAGQDEVQHQVEITKAFYMAVTETTQEQYEAVMGENPSYFQKGEVGAEKVQGKDTSKFPVEKISWEDATKFSSKCQEKTKSKEVRLPTEAEWEYACRAGTETVYHVGEEITDKKANIDGKLGRTEQVGDYVENGFGLFDMHGNVWEWCLDGYRKDYEKLESKDPIEKQSNDRRVLRGGSWGNLPAYCRSANRYSSAPDNRIINIGFRVVVLP